MTSIFIRGEEIQSRHAQREDMRRERRRMPWVDGGRDWRDASTSQGMLTIASNTRS